MYCASGAGTEGKKTLVCVSNALDIYTTYAWIVNAALCQKNGFTSTVKQFAEYALCLYTLE